HGWLDFVPGSPPGVGRAGGPNGSFTTPFVSRIGLSIAATGGVGAAELRRGIELGGTAEGGRFAEGGHVTDGRCRAERVGGRGGLGPRRGFGGRGKFRTRGVPPGSDAVERVGGGGVSRGADVVRSPGDSAQRRDHGFDRIADRIRTPGI